MFVHRLNLHCKLASSNKTNLLLYHNTGCIFRLLDLPVAFHLLQKQAKDPSRTITWINGTNTWLKIYVVRITVTVLWFCQFYIKSTCALQYYSLAQADYYSDKYCHPNITVLDFSPFFTIVFIILFLIL